MLAQGGGRIGIAQPPVSAPVSGTSAPTTSEDNEGAIASASALVSVPATAINETGSAGSPGPVGSPDASVQQDANVQ